jgi:hypothetical protein
MKANETEERTGKRETQYEYHVEPERRARTGSEMYKVREYIRSIREKDDPTNQQKAENPAITDIPDSDQGSDRPRNESEKKIPP